MKKKLLQEQKEKAIIESFAKTYNKIKRAYEPKLIKEAELSWSTDIPDSGMCKCIKEFCPWKRRNQPRDPCINVGDICTFEWDEESKFHSPVYNTVIGEKINVTRESDGYKLQIHHMFFPKHFQLINE